MKIGLLASGNLGKVVLNHLINKEYDLDFVMTDKNSHEIIELLQNKNIDLFIGNPRNSNCEKFIENKNIDVIISANYLFIIDKQLIDLPSKLAFNIHGSLLPKYRGRTPHVWAIINNEAETGVTAHVIDEGCDTGDIIEQIKVPINDCDTGADILNKYSELYIPLIEKVLIGIKNNKINTQQQDEVKATYFGKRTPLDGEINWAWQKERIHNWIRAQSFPYPGAFSYIDDQKIIIDKISYSDVGYKSDIQDGFILEDNPTVIVKTPNGAIELIDIRIGKEHCVKGIFFNSKNYRQNE